MRDAFRHPISATRSRGRSGRSSGFTLLELMVVIAIVGIMTSMGTATWSTAQTRAQVGSAGKALAGLVASARLRAQSTRSFVKLVISTSGRGSVVVQECKKAFGDYDPTGCTFTSVRNGVMDLVMGQERFSRVRLSATTGTAFLISPLGVGHSSNADITVSFDDGRGHMSSSTHITPLGMASSQ